MFWFILDKPLRSSLPGGISWSLERYIHFVLLLAGSPFTVGVADEEPCNCALPSAPEHFHIPTIMSGVVHVIHAKPKPTPVMPAKPKPAHITSATPRPLHVLSAKLDPAHITSATLRPLHVLSAKPDPAHVMLATQEPLHKIPTNSRTSHKMSANQESRPIMAANPETL